MVPMVVKLSDRNQAIAFEEQYRAVGDGPGDAHDERSAVYATKIGDYNDCELNDVPIK